MQFDITTGNLCTFKYEIVYPVVKVQN